jgi:hypothetical protein
MPYRAIVIIKLSGIPSTPVLFLILELCKMLICGIALLAKQQGLKSDG